MLDDLSGRQWVICHLIIVAAVTMLVAPLFRYVLLGWHAKRRDIMEGFDRDAVCAYYKMFGRGAAAPAEGKELEEFGKLHTRWYGRRFFILPGVILFFVGYVAVTLVAYTALHRAGYIDNPAFDLDDIALAALSGAYLWVVHDQILRSRRLDFSPSDVLWSGLRFVIAVPMAYAITSVLAADVRPFIAFALGAFPLTGLLAIVRRVAEQKWQPLASTPQEARDDLVKLQGVNKQVVERLENEDLTTIPQVAYCDPVQVVMRSNLSFAFVSDCMNQALAWMYLEERLAALRPLGLRGAVEIRNLVEAYDDEDAPDEARRRDHEYARAAFPRIAAALGQDESTVQLVFREIAGDPYTRFLSSVWF